MKQQMKLKGIFLSKSESVKTPDDRFMTIVKFLVDEEERGFTFFTDTAWLNSPDTNRPLNFNAELVLNPTTKAVEFTKPSWNYR